VVVDVDPVAADVLGPGSDALFAVPHAASSAISVMVMMVVRLLMTFGRHRRRVGSRPLRFIGRRARTKGVDEPPIRVERANTILYCERWRECVEFYGNTLGFAVSFENEWFVEFSVAGTAMLSVADARRATIAPSAAGITLAWHVESVTEARARLVGLGVAVTPLARRWGSTVCYCHDPDGHRIELWTPGD